MCSSDLPKPQTPNPKPQTPVAGVLLLLTTRRRPEQERGGPLTIQRMENGGQRSRWRAIMFGITMVIQGLVGPLFAFLIYHQDGLSGDLCSNLYDVHMILWSLLYTLEPLIWMLGLIVELYKTGLVGDSLLLFKFFQETTCMDFVGFQSLACLIAFLTNLNYCSPQYKTLSDGQIWKYVIFIGFLCLADVGLFLIVALRQLSHLNTVLRNKAMWFPRLGLGPWIDRKKRAALLQKLIRCAGTKEGCRLLATEYCEQLLNYQKCFEHSIVLEYIRDTLTRSFCYKLQIWETVSCMKCEDKLTQKKPLIFWKNESGEKRLIMHLYCFTSLSKAELESYIPDQRELISSLQKYIDEELPLEPPAPIVIAVPPPAAPDNAEPQPVDEVPVQVQAQVAPEIVPPEQPPAPPQAV